MNEADRKWYGIDERKNERRSLSDRRSHVPGGDYVTPSERTGKRLKYGQLYHMEGRIWRCGLVNECRARMDPVTGSVAVPDPNSGRVHRRIGDSVSIGPFVDLVEATDDELDEFGQRRLIRLLEAEVHEIDAIEARASVKSIEREIEELQRWLDEHGGDEDGDVVGDGDEASVAAMPSTFAGFVDDDGGQYDTDPDIENVAAMPDTFNDSDVPEEETDIMATATDTKKAEAQKRIDELKAKKAAQASKVAAPPTAKEAKAPREKKVKEPKECQCGCGGTTNGYFVPGHDAKFKSEMLKVERGEAKKEEVFEGRDEILAKYKWVPSGQVNEKTNLKGQRTLTNYKGEPHEGYDLKFLAAAAQ